MTEIWRIVAEDFAAFDVDMTTEEPTTIDRRVCRVLITEKKQVGNNNGNMPNSAGQSAGYAWVDVYNTPNYIADFAPALGKPGVRHCRLYIVHSICLSVAVFPNSNVARVM